MTATLGVAEFLRQAHARRTAIREELANVRQLDTRHQDERRGLADQLDQVTADLASNLLPAMTRDAVARAVRLSGFAALAQTDPLAAIEADRQALGARLEQIEADPAWRDRVRLRAPRTGTLTRQIEELEDFRKPLEEVMTRVAHPRLERLLSVGYGTDEYKVGFWRISYYSDWAAGDQIVEKFPDKKTFAEVREEVLRVRPDLAVYNAKLAELRAEVTAGDALESEHAAHAAALPTLEARHLAAWQKRLRKHVAGLDPALIADRLTGEPDVELLWKQRQGVDKKIAYLDQLVDKQTDEFVATLNSEDAQLAREIDKYERPKNSGVRFDATKLQRRFQERPAKLRKSWDRTVSTYDTVSAFERYDRARFIEDFLWWDLMTAGRYDGSYIPEVSSFHESRPDYHFDPQLWADHSDHEGHAAAVVAATDFSADVAGGIADAHDGVLDPS